MANFTAYFDASGHPSNQPFVIVSGYVANHYQWLHFNRAWEVIHERANIKMPFHMAAFAARRQNYKGLGIDDPKAKEFVIDLAIAQQILISP